MKQTRSLMRTGIMWFAALVLVIVVCLDIYTYRTQHAYYLDQDRDSDTRILAQTVGSLLRDQPDAFEDWPAIFVTGDGTGLFYCRALDQEIPIVDVKTLLAPYIRLLPRDPGINVPHVSLYYLRQHDTGWSVGNCARQLTDEVEV